MEEKEKISLCSANIYKPFINGQIIFLLVNFARPRALIYPSSQSIYNLICL